MTARDLPPIGRWVARLGEDGPRERRLFHGSAIGINEFRCDPGGLGWSREARTGPWHLVVFPGPSVVIRQEGRGSVVANRNTAVFYEPGQVYRREPLEGQGDHCIVVATSPDVLADVAAAAGTWPPEADAFAFPTVAGSVDPGAFLLQRRVARYVFHDPAADPLLVEEASLSVLASVVGGALSLGGAANVRPPRRAGTRHGHADAVVQAAGYLTRRFADRFLLEDVARAAHVSQFHLARMFRTATGYTLHGYRHHLRLRHAAERLLADRADLVDVVAESGFASHAHLTDSFRRAFGRPPSAVRSANDVAEVRRILEAPPAGLP